MNFKVGDKVVVIAGKDKGKEGTIIGVLRDRERVIVEGINIVKKHMKPSQTNETGGILSVEAPIHVSNVKVIEGKETKKETKKTTTKKSTKKEVGEK